MIAYNDQCTAHAALPQCCVETALELESQPRTLEDAQLNKHVAALLLLFTFAFGSTAIAGTAYTNLQSGTYNAVAGWTVGGINSGVGLVISASQFTSLVSGNVSQIDVGLGFFQGDNEATISLWTDALGLPGTNLSGFINAPASPIFGTCCQLTTVAVAGVPIVAGQQYFVVIEADAVTWDAWNLNDTGAIGQLDQYTSFLGWQQYPGQTLGAMDVSTSNTPEPGTVIMLSTGLLGVLGAMRRRPKAS
jgi:hypothetical protein